MYYRHKGHGFNITTAQLPATQRWIFLAEINKDGEQRVRKIDSKETFTTAKEAQNGRSQNRKKVDRWTVNPSRTEQGMGSLFREQR
jgi:hypothetical protein